MPDLKYGKKDVARMAAVLNAEYECVEDAAHAALVEAEKIYQDKSKFILLGQLRFSPTEGTVKPEYADKISVAAFATEKQAQNAGISLAYSTQTHEEFRWWVVPIHHGTPAEYYRSRKEIQNAKNVEDMSWSERELARRVKWVAENPGAELPEDMRGPVPFIDPAVKAERDKRENQ